MFPAGFVFLFVDIFQSVRFGLGEVGSAVFGGVFGGRGRAFGVRRRGRREHPVTEFLELIRGFGSVDERLQFASREKTTARTEVILQAIARLLGARKAVLPPAESILPELFLSSTLRHHLAPEQRPTIIAAVLAPTNLLRSLPSFPNPRRLSAPGASTHPLPRRLPRASLRAIRTHVLVDEILIPLFDADALAVEPVVAGPVTAYHERPGIRFAADAIYIV